MYISYGVLLLVAIPIIRQLRFAAKHFTPPTYTSELGEEIDMPSVTVCIPARNEMHAVAACLEKVVASDYQRLEIIVLDDVSGDDTSSLIKAFAHDGVRFVQGKALPEGWLGKNHALQGLLKEASGSYILFMDVDTHIAPNAVSNMVRYALSQRASMVSVLPRREDGWRLSVIFSPLRYFWEIIFHRRLFPATASSAWLINRNVLLERFNGFKELKDAVQPESKISSSLALTNEYRFLISTQQFGVAYEKKWRSQLATSKRLLFPFLENKVTMALVAIIDLLLMILPAYIAIATFVVFGGSWIHFLAMIIALLYSGIYGWYAHRVWKKGALIGAIVWPVLIIQEMLLVIASVIQYKFRSIEWKGRKVYWAGTSKLKDEP